MLEQRVRVEMVQILAGHDKLSTTMEYVHILEKRQAREAMAALDKKMKRKRK